MGGLTLIEGLSGVLTDDAGIALSALLCFRGDVVAADTLEITAARLQERESELEKDKMRSERGRTDRCV
jgi:hypothetical protein